jgi:hypothetical protein
MPVNGSEMQKYANSLGVYEPVNGSWIQAVCAYYGIQAPVNGSWQVSINEYHDVLSPVNGNFPQHVAEHFGGTLVNGSWIATLAEVPPVSVGLYVDIGYWDPHYAVNE